MMRHIYATEKKSYFQYSSPENLVVVKPQAGGHGTWEEIEIVKFDGVCTPVSGMLPLGMPIHS